MTAIFHKILPNVTVIERGWLNCNQIVLQSPNRNVLVDSGYGHHAGATLGYVGRVLNGGPLHWLINTHCHSDHMGGNRAVRAHYDCRVTIPEGEVKHIVPWTEQSCWSQEMDQYAEEFAFDDTMLAGDSFEGGGLRWHAYAAPGHDMDALIFIADEARIVITGDALWERGMGFVWPQPLTDAQPNPFIRTARTVLDTIEQLNPAIVVPGHGAPFSNVASALQDARGKLAAFERDPAKNARHAAKSLFVFALLDRREMKVADVPRYIDSVPVYRRMREQFQLGENDAFASAMLDELIMAKALKVEDGFVRPTMRA